ncbi:MAG: SURF1 family protein [Bdellovibrionales bacterium]|nr:SURF1 family protein [Bdellovibrionales bacterium]
MSASRRFSFSFKITSVCTTLAFGMVCAAVWQWERHVQKEMYLAELHQRLTLPPAPIASILPQSPDRLLHRRALISGTYDFEHEMVLRNRKDDIDGPGVHLLTPLKLNDGQMLLVDRGYIPLSVQAKEKRQILHKDNEESFTGLLKVSAKKRLFAPNDPPTGEGHPWVDAWLRVDLKKIGEQLPYPILPFYAEIMNEATPEQAQHEIVKSSKGRQDIFFLGSSTPNVSTGELNPNRSYPVPAHSTVVPSATHLAYVYEWSFMALLTLLIGYVLQLRRTISSKTDLTESP